MANNRYRQIDPTKLPGEFLLVYLRLATGSSLIQNFASRNAFYTFDDYEVKSTGLSFIEDFIETERYSYDKELDLVVSQKLRTYHTVCPVHTYYMKQYCYKEPANRAILAIFPRWSAAQATLTWEMTLMHSSMINHEVIQFLTTSWGSSDTILKSFFDKSSFDAESANSGKLHHYVPSRVLRHENEYEIQAHLTNEEVTFLKSDSVKFSPSKCKWFTIVDNGVSEGYSIFQSSPGTDDIKF